MTGWCQIQGEITEEIHPVNREVLIKPSYQINGNCFQLTKGGYETICGIEEKNNISDEFREKAKILKIHFVACL